MPIKICNLFLVCRQLFPSWNLITTVAYLSRRSSTLTKRLTRTYNKSIRPPSPPSFPLSFYLFLFLANCRTWSRYYISCIPPSISLTQPLSIPVFLPLFVCSLLDPSCSNTGYLCHSTSFSPHPLSYFSSSLQVALSHSFIPSPYHFSLLTFSLTIRFTLLYSLILPSCFPSISLLFRI